MQLKSIMGMLIIVALTFSFLQLEFFDDLVLANDETGDPSLDEAVIVDINGNGNYTSISEAINNSAPGDILRVFSGTYKERIEIDRPLTLMGNGSDNTTIDGDGWFDVVTITSDDVHISGFNIINSGNSFYFQDNDAGVKMIQSNDCVISDCYFYNTSNDIWLEGSNNNTISGNVFNWTYWGGVSIGVSNSNYNTFRKNSCTYDLNFTYHIRERDGYVTLDESYIGRIGLLLSSSFQNKVTSNDMLGRGIVIDASSFSHYLQDIDLTNTVGGKTIYYLDNEVGVDIPSDAGQVMLIYSSNCNISNANFNNQEESILFVYSDNNTIFSNRFTNASWGIHLIHSNNNKIVSNHFYHNDNAIDLDDSINNQIKENNCTSNVIGVNLLGSDDNIIDGNILGYNEDVGMKLVASDSNLISNNALSMNLIGFSLESSSWNQIINNTVTASKKKGFMLYSTSNDNQIYHNNLIGNTIQVSDSGGNTWSSNDNEGNYWSDYRGEDDGASDRGEGDGIGDTNLTFHGLDQYPFIEPDGWLDNERSSESSLNEDDAQEESNGQEEILGPYGLIAVMVAFSFILVVLFFWAQRKGK